MDERLYVSATVVPPKQLMAEPNPDPHARFVRLVLVVEQPYDVKTPPNKSVHAPTQEYTGGSVEYAGPWPTKKLPTMYLSTLKHAILGVGDDDRLALRVIDRVRVMLGVAVGVTACEPVAVRDSV